MSGGFFRGTSSDQDSRFSNKNAKLLKSQKFAAELDELVDMTRVKKDVMLPWIAKRVTELLGVEDEVLINFIFSLLEGKKVDGKHIQIQITGFMEKHTYKFMKELWCLLLSAQRNISGIPQKFLDEKAEEARKKKEAEKGILSEIGKRREQQAENAEVEAARRKASEAAARLTASLLGKPIEVVKPPAPVAVVPEAATVIGSSAQTEVEVTDAVKEGDKKADTGVNVPQEVQKIDGEVQEGDDSKDQPPGNQSILEEREPQGSRGDQDGRRVISGRRSRSRSPPARYRDRSPARYDRYRRSPPPRYRRTPPQSRRSPPGYRRSGPSYRRSPPSYRRSPPPSRSRPSAADVSFRGRSSPRRRDSPPAPHRHGPPRDVPYREGGEREEYRAGARQPREPYDDEDVDDRVDVNRDRGNKRESNAALDAGQQRSGKGQPVTDEDFSEEEGGGRGREERSDGKKPPPSFRRSVPIEGYEDEEDMHDEIHEGERSVVARDGKKYSGSKCAGIADEEEAEDFRGRRTAEGSSKPSQYHRDNGRAGSDNEEDQAGELGLSRREAAKYQSKKREEDYDDEKIAVRGKADSGRQLSFSKQEREAGGSRPREVGREVGRSFRSGMSAGSGRSIHDAYDRADRAERRGGGREGYAERKPFSDTGAARERKSVYDEEEDDYARPENGRRGVVARNDEKEKEAHGPQGARANSSLAGGDEFEEDVIEGVGVGAKRKHATREDAFGLDVGGEGGNKAPGEEPATSEERRELKRRKKEEKRVKKEEKRKRKEEKRKRKEEKRAAKEAMKSGGVLAAGQQHTQGSVYMEEEGDDDDDDEDDMEGSGREDGVAGSGGLKKGGDLRRLEEELRQKALESLKAKKA